MNLFKWWSNRRSRRGAALILYKRGMRKANRHDLRGATNDYTAVIDMPDTPTDVVAMALYNRALLYAAAGDTPKATDDLNAVLAMMAPLHKIKSAARQKLERMQHRKTTGAASRAGISVSS